MTEKRVQNKIALITGAAQGIGKAIAFFLVREGAQVIISEINDSLSMAVAQELGANCSYLHLDVTQEIHWQECLTKITKNWGLLNILVNNAGITGFQEGFGVQDPENASLESWKKIHTVNSDGTFLGCKYAIQTMKNTTNGSIINISSRSGIVGVPGAAAYAASKAAIRNHTKTVALYCCQQSYSIRCNSIHPAAILTPMWEPMLGTNGEREIQLAKITKEIPMQKMRTVEDVAAAVLFLASDESKYITGIELTIDGGILAGTNAVPKIGK